MDLLGNIGTADQLVSAREEIKVLQIMVKELSEKVKFLTVDNEALRAEVEMYRQEFSLPNFSKLALGEGNNTLYKKASMISDMTHPSSSNDDFITPGNGIFPTNSVVSLSHLHGPSNPLCCALHPKNDSILATGGADSYVTLTYWGSALNPGPNSASDTVNNALKIKCNAPVISIAFPHSSFDLQNILAVGCMDGSVEFVTYSCSAVSSPSLKGYRLPVCTSHSGDFTQNRSISTESNPIKHQKYIKCLAWSTSSSSSLCNILVSASADGIVHVSRIQIVSNKMEEDEDVAYGDADDSLQLKIEKVTSFFLQRPVETLCFVHGGSTLCLYERDTPYLTYFDLQDNYKQTRHGLNEGASGGFDDHVSFTVMQLVLSPNGKYLCAALDTSRIIILDAKTGRIVRNLYGHKTDPYFQPRVAWSLNGQYVFGNTQDDNSICVWDVASSTIVTRLDDQSYSGHSGQIRDIYSSTKSDTIVTASYDKTIKVWTCI